jgi:uncharacterized membrane-anchored protein
MKASLIFGRFIIPLGIQTAAFLAVAIPPLYTEWKGELVTLETEPVNLSKFMRNSSNQINYNISAFQALEEVSGWEELPGTPLPCPENTQSRNRENRCNPNAKLLDPDLTLYAVLEPPSPDSGGRVPSPWVPVRVSRDRPTKLGENQIILRGKSLEDRVEYGGEKFHLMRLQREEILATLDLTQTEEKLETLVIQLKVNPRGNAIPVNLWIGDRNYPLSN